MKPHLFPVVPVVVGCLVIAFAALGCTGEPEVTVRAASTGDGDTFVGRVYDASGELTDPVTLPRVRKADAAWRKQLTADEYRIVREHGTERAFTGALLENKAGGVYRCVACDLPLFPSDTKFKSGTGWPSFFRPIAPENVGETKDSSHGMTRTEIHCARCEGHLGHVFTDGPRPTNLRYCVNSASIAFTPKDELKTLAEPVAMRPDKSDLSSAVFAGGCFWCVEAVFEELDGVDEALSGYAGGTAETADYRSVCSGRTGHAEVVKIVYDPKKISYEELLRVHFATHDPTQLNRQGPDVGPQYRSAVFYSNDEEKAVAGAFIEDLNDQKVFGRPVVTTLEPLARFFPAETYHQDYVCRNPGEAYIQAVALPKVAKVRKQFKERLKDESPLERTDRP